jgi:transcriptional regulator of acetoin/glycerol metabolism
MSGANVAWRQAAVKYHGAELRKLLTETHGNVTAAARKSGVARSWLNERLKRLGLNPADFRRRPR